MRIFILLILFSFPCISFSQEYLSDTLRIFYPIDVTTLGDAGKKSLDSLSAMVKRNRKASLSITGYADYLGTNPHNVDLSVSRSAKVREYLIRQGVDSSQVKICQGKGAIQPGDERNPAKGIPFHRRTDVVVTWPVLKKPPPKAAAKKNSPPERLLDDTPKTINIKNLKKGDQFVLRDLNFVGGRHLLIPQSLKTLWELTNIMKQNPGLKIEIQGHICCDTSSVDGFDYDTKTEDLSLQRAKVVYEHLVHMGIDSSRVSYKGFGGKVRLVKVERTEEDRQRNRRVEIKILEK